MSMAPEAESLSVDTYLAAFEKNGGIVEERITGEALDSPSVQMRALPDGTVELLSTHDQLLGGAKRSEVPGLRVPGQSRLRGRHRRAGHGVSASAWRSLGALGRFAVDFVVVQDEHTARGRRTPSS